MILKVNIIWYIFFLIYNEKTLDLTLVQPSVGTMIVFTKRYAASGKAAS